MFLRTVLLLPILSHLVLPAGPGTSPDLDSPARNSAVHAQPFVPGYNVDTGSIDRLEKNGRNSGSLQQNGFITGNFQQNLRNTEIQPQTGRNAVREEDKFRIARIKYRGGGDWYNDPSALTNLIDFAVHHIPISIQRTYDDVSIGSRELHRYPFAFMTGHGNIDINATEAANMREYLDNGGFLYIDDDYGFDPYVRPVIEKIFPDEELVELPATHPIYSMVFGFPDGLPKIHVHDDKPPQGFGIFRNGHLVLFYTYESNLADGWAFDVHDNPEDITQKSLRMGVNLLVYVFSGSK